MKQLVSILIVCIVSLLSARVAVHAAEAQHTYEFGACEQQLMWRDGGKLSAQLEHLDAMKKAGAGWVRLSLMIDEKTDWDNLVFVQYRIGLDKVGRLTRILHDLNKQFFKGEPEIITAGLVAYDTINKAWLKKVNGCIIDQELTLQLLHGSYPKQKGATNWLQYVDGIGMHIYPATVDLNPKTALAEIKADLDPCRTVPGVGSDPSTGSGQGKPFWITECGYASDKCGNDENRRYKQLTVFYNALDAYERKDSSIKAVMHFCWSKEAMARHALWDHGKFYKAADIFKVQAGEPRRE